jgi:hypothetical protein
MDIGKMYDFSLSIAKYLNIKYQSRESFGSHFAIIFGDEYIMYTQPFSDYNEKISYINTACLIMKAFKATGYIVINESWTLPQSVVAGLTREQIKDIQTKGISDHPERVELLAIVGENDTHHLMANHSIQRNDQGQIQYLHKVEDVAPPVMEKTEEFYSRGLFTDCLRKSNDLIVPEEMLSITRNAFKSSVQRVSDLDASINRLLN